MRAYVIKNKKGRYWAGKTIGALGLFIQDEGFKGLHLAKIYDVKEKAEEVRTRLGGEIVEISIVEGDLEKPNQKAIECLKEVREELISNGQSVVGTGVNAVRLYTINKIIDNKIKELEEGK